MSNFRGKCFFRKLDIFLLSLNFQLKTPCPQNQLKIQIEKEKIEVSEKNIFPENLKKISIFSINFFENLKKISIFFFLKKICFVFGNPTVVVQKRRLVGKSRADFIFLEYFKQKKR